MIVVFFCVVDGYHDGSCLGRVFSAGVVNEIENLLR